MTMKLIEFGACIIYEFDQELCEHKILLLANELNELFSGFDKNWMLFI